MAHEPNAEFLRAVILGRVAPLDPSVAARLIVLHAQHHGDGDEDLADLLGRASVAQTRAADRLYLESLIDGTGDLLAEDTFTRMEPMFVKYPEGSEMYALLEKAAVVYGDAAVAAACWLLAGQVIDEVRRDRSDS